MRLQVLGSQYPRFGVQANPSPLQGSGFNQQSLAAGGLRRDLSAYANAYNEAPADLGLPSSPAAARAYLGQNVPTQQVIKAAPKNIGQRTQQGIAAGAPAFRPGAQNINQQPKSALRRILDIF